MTNLQNIKLAVCRAAIVLCPSYTAAWLTDKMVYVVPTLAGASFFAASLGPRLTENTRNVDEDGQDDDSDGDIESGVGTLDQ